MHLTNYSINKNSKDFIKDDEAGSKRSVYTRYINCVFYLTLYCEMKSLLNMTLKPVK